MSKWLEYKDSEAKLLRQVRLASVHVFIEYRSDETYLARFDHILVNQNWDCGRVLHITINVKSPHIDDTMKDVKGKWHFMGICSECDIVLFTLMAGNRWIPSQKSSNVDLWCFLLGEPQKTAEPPTKLTLTSDTIARIMMTSSKWKLFPRDWPFVRGIHRSSVNSPHKGQWRGA